MKLKERVKSYEKWKNNFDKEYELFKVEIGKKVEIMTMKEFNKFAKCQMLLAKKMGVFK